MKTLILVDLQNDFCFGGKLAVPEGEQVVAVANALMKQCDLVVATRDWHPANHGSFANNHPGKKIGECIQLAGLEQILWPSHCVQNTFGAEFHSDVATNGIDEVFFKGTDPMVDSYSGFFDNQHRNATGLEAYLKEKGVTAITIAGLATDYCVKFTVLDALDLGFEVTVVTDGCRAVNIQPGDGDKAIAEMVAKGAKVTISSNMS
ncbi:MAG: bifunctional nicotinamidase/pyrazinamidase [Proteobacteria bacterium]|nr:bifunctional nicotinamidase/pyrazinamidase [Pseudomonadota bacterium]